MQIFRPRPKAENWQMWVLQRARPIAFAIAMALISVVLLLFGGDKPTN